MSGYPAKHMYDDWVMKGHQFFRALDYDEAIKCYEKAIAAAPQNSDPVSWKGQSLFMQEKYTLAMSCYQKAQGICGHSVSFYSFLQGEVFFWQKNYKKAYESFKEALSLDKKGVSKLKDSEDSHDKKQYDVPIERKKHVASRSSKKNSTSESKAMSKYVKILEMRPTEANSFRQKVQALIHKRQFEEVVRGCEVMRSFKHDSRYIKMGWATEGLACTVQGQYDQAIKLYEEAKRFSKDEGWVFAYQGVAYFCSGNVEKSQECFQEALRFPEDSPYFPMLGLGICELTRGNSDKASELFAEAEKQVASETDLTLVKEFWLLRGLLSAKVSAYSEAIAAFKKLSEIDPYPNSIVRKELPVLQKLAAESIPKYKEDWVLQGDHHFEIKNYDKAIECYDGALAIAPRYQRALLSKGKTLHCQAKNNEALICFDQVLAIDSKDVVAWYFKGKIHYLNSTFDEAEKSLEQARTLNPQDTNILLFLGKTLYWQGKSPQAIRCYDEALKINPKHALALTGKGEVFRARGKYDEALEFYNKALAIDPTLRETWAEKSIVLVKQGKNDEAMRFYDEVLKISPNDFWILKEKVQLLVHMGRDDEALKACEVMLSNQSDPWCSYVGRTLKGVVFAVQGNNHEAIKFYDESLKFFAGDNRALGYKGIAYFCCHDVEKSLECFQEALRADEKQYFAMLGLGVYEFSQGNADKASQLFTKAEALVASEDDVSSMKDFWFFRGQLFTAIEAFTEANAAFEKLQSIAPNNVPAKIQLRMLQALLARQMSSTSTNVPRQTQFAANQKLAPPTVAPLLANLLPERLKAYKPILIDSNQLIFEKDPIGEGSFGVVSKATWRVMEKLRKVVAVKRFKTDEMTPQDMDNFLREVDILRKFESDGLVRFYGITDTEPHGMVMAFMDEGSLHKVLSETPREAFLWEERLSMSLNVSVGLEYLHRNGVIHRDIKSLNILVSKKRKAKLCDFGLSVQSHELAEHSAEDSKGVVGSLRWIAPEIFENAPANPATDVYSFGVVLWEFWSHNFPFRAAGRDDALVRAWVTGGTREKFDNSLPDTPQEFIDLTHRCWHQNPTNRPTAAGIVEELTKLSALFKLRKSSAPPPPVPQRLRKETPAAYEINSQVKTGSARLWARPTSAAPSPPVSSRNSNVSSAGYEVNSGVSGSSGRVKVPPNSPAPSSPVAGRSVNVSSNGYQMGIRKSPVEASSRTSESKVNVSSNGYQMDSRKSAVSAVAPKLPPRKSQQASHLESTASSLSPK